MHTFEAIRTRRAVKHYDPKFQIPPEQEQELMDLVRQTPTSFNTQNWRFVKLTDPALRQKVRDVAWGQAQITDASLVYVVCGDLSAYAKDPARYMVNYPKEISDMYVPKIIEFYEGKDWQQRDEAMRSAGLAAQTLMLAARAMGYESCPMIGFDSEAVGELINLPSDHVVCMIVVVGKGIEPARPKGGYIDNEEVFIENGF
ncbi:MAG: nitroreductase family protein [Alphaproteobacteria bacterium]|nr:nitroreductase family protein [Alphaproteobacteria bacterium]